MPASGDRAARLRVLFMGTPALAVPTLEAVAEHHDVAAVVTQPDRPAGRGRELTPSPVKEWAVEHGVEVLQPPTLRDAAVRSQLAATRPHVAVVVAFGQLLPPEVLAIPPLGCVNLHASLLPRHRGASPIQAAILAGDPVTGVTTMLMDEGLDTGPILLAREVPIGGDDTAGTLGVRLGHEGAALMVETLAALRDGRVEPRSQASAEATMTRLIRKADGRIDWQRPAAEIERTVRAMQPWPVAFTTHGGVPIKIWRAAPAAAPAAAAAAAPAEDRAADAPPWRRPGTAHRPGDRLVVDCGEGTALEVQQLQRPGGRRLPTGEFLRGFPVADGDLLGEDAGEDA